MIWRPEVRHIMKLPDQLETSDLCERSLRLIDYTPLNSEIVDDKIQLDFLEDLNKSFTLRNIQIHLAKKN